MVMAVPIASAQHPSVHGAALVLPSCHSMVAAALSFACLENDNFLRREVTEGETARLSGRLREAVPEEWDQSCKATNMIAPG